MGGIAHKTENAGSVRWLLAALVVLPALAVLPAVHGGRVIYVLYREPKQTLISVLGWALLVAWAWAHRHIEPRAWRQAASSLPMLCFLLLIAWMALSRLWCTVPANHLLELRGWLLTFLLTAAIVAGARLRPELPWLHWLRCSLVGAAGVVTLIGIVQLLVPIPGLVPIDADRYGVAHSSTFGYKNPAALFVVGQIFVLAGVALEARGRLRLAAWGLLVAEIVYVTSLQSRTSLLALLAGALVWAMLPARGGRRWAAAALLAIAGAGLLLSPASRERAATLLSRLEPGAYLESDRGVYLRNTLAMVERHPLGVGLGDWQTQYPVFRRHGRQLAYDGVHQVRRAHGDHVQMLGELGWPGLAIWLALLGSALCLGFRRRSPAVVAVTSQIFAFTVAMAGDYVVEMPYHRMQFGLLLALLLVQAGERAGVHRPSAAGVRSAAWPGKVLLAALAVAWLSESALAVLALRGATIEAEVERTYRAAFEVSAPAERRPLLQRASGAAGRLADAPFHSKTRFRADLMAAHVEHLLGRRSQACAHLERSLMRYPYNPPAMQLAARLVREKPRLEAWNRASRHVLLEAETGFKLDYPEIGCD